jgi:hypothetical protein
MSATESGMRLIDVRDMRMSGFKGLDVSSLLDRPEFEKLELPDLQTYLNGLTEEERAALRESTPCTSYHLV